MKSNPHKATVGCLVPLCQRPVCDHAWKKKCALRAWFLREQAELRRQARGLWRPEAISIQHSRIYFWRQSERNDKTA